MMMRALHTSIYVGMTGQTCMFGGSMTSRIYQVCSSGATTPFSSIVHESYYDCEVFIALHSQAACSGGNFPPSKKRLLVLVLVLLFLSLSPFFLCRGRRFEGIGGLPRSLEAVLALHCSLQASPFDPPAMYMRLIFKFLWGVRVPFFFWFPRPSWPWTTCTSRTPR